LRALTVFTTGLGQFDAVHVPLPACAHAFPVGVTVIETTSPGVKLVTDNVVVLLDTLPVMGLPPLMVYEYE